MIDYEQLRAAVDAKLSTDPEFRTIMKRISSGRATFIDTARYSQVLSHILGSEVSKKILDVDGREAVVSHLLHDSYEDINDVFSRVQTDIDKKKGLNIKPRQGEYPGERIEQFVHSLVDPTVEDSVIKRRARAGTETITKSFHDDCVEENAKLHEEAGLKTYIIRMGTDCCQWCSDVAGKYEMKDQPQGIFRRHDNCDCTVIYDGQVLRGQAGDNGKRSKKWVEVPKNAGAAVPTRLTQEQAKDLEKAKMADIDYMSNSFRPQYSEQVSNISIGDISITTKQVENSEFNLITDVTEDKRSKAVRLTEKNLKEVQKFLPDNFEFPQVAVVNFEKQGLNVNAIGGYDPQNNTMFINSKYDTTNKILKYVNAQPYQFANKTELSPILHELGHKYYEDCVKILANSKKIGYNEAKDIIDSQIQVFVHDNIPGDISKIISMYADAGYKQHKYTEVVAECFSVMNSNAIANNLIRLLKGVVD